MVPDLGTAWSSSEKKSNVFLFHHDSNSLIILKVEKNALW
jgi:hypothetical protein